jgi:dephospho-CoA kinase
MTIIGLVGRIGAGKSTVARELAAHGAEIIDADQLAHDALADPAVVQEIIGQFGAAVLDSQGHVRRPALAAEVFGPTPTHERALVALEAILHPRVRRRIEERLASLAAAPDAAARVVVLDVPLLMQVGMDDLCDRLILVACDEPERQRRRDARGWDATQGAARERAWELGYHPPAPEKTCVVDTTGDPTYTSAQVGRFWDSLRRH